MKLKILISVFCILVSFTSCFNFDDDSPKVAPPITQENSFSCKINGELFIPEPHGGLFASSPPIRAILQDNNTWGFNMGNGAIEIYMYVYDATETGEYIITASDGNINYVGETENLVEMTDFYTPGVVYISTNNNDKINVLELEIDNKIIFEFDEITLINNTDPEDVIIFSEGKLNVNLETLNQED